MASNLAEFRDIAKDNKGIKSGYAQYGSFQRFLPFLINLTQIYACRF